MALKKYKIIYTYSSKIDVQEMKKYILDKFKYSELGNNFTKKIKQAVSDLKILPKKNNLTGFQFRGHDIYLKTYHTYLLFYTVNDMNGTVTVLRVLKDGMNWQYILRKWLYERENNRHVQLAQIDRRVMEMLHSSTFLLFWEDLNNCIIFR